MFLIPLDARREWFRYHNLFQDLLRLELGREAIQDDAISDLHSRAATWLAATPVRSTRRSGSTWRRAMNFGRCGSDRPQLGSDCLATR